MSICVYLDTSVYNRPFDDQTQTRIHLEAEAVLSIIQSVEDHEWQWISSDAVAYEINKAPMKNARSVCGPLNHVQRSG